MMDQVVPFHAPEPPAAKPPVVRTVIAGTLMMEFVSL